jgi:catechol 2,3-dioxygenase-like lactoylglutathione lyase family enzyme
VVDLDRERVAFRFGEQQLNVHGRGSTPDLVARVPVAPGTSVYFRDPDGALLELVSYES